MTLSELFHNFSALGPELVLTAALCVLIVADMFTPLARSRAVCGGLALAGAVAALGVLLSHMTSASGGRSSAFFGGMFMADPMAQYFKLLFLCGLAATLLFSLRSRELTGYRHGEYVTLLMGATLSACLLASANNFVLFVVALETLSMCSYVLAGFVKHERRSAEAGLKYMLYGAVASGVMMFGLSYLFGLGGSLQIDTCVSRVALLFIQMHGTPLILVAVLLVLVGVGFKIAMVPFHFWCPDVYQGAPHSRDRVPFGRLQGGRFLGVAAARAAQFHGVVDIESYSNGACAGHFSGSLWHRGGRDDDLRQSGRHPPARRQAPAGL